MPLPEELIGRWETTQPAYADRFFELSANAIVIGTGGVSRQRHRISEVSRITDDLGLLYTVTYQDAASGETRMSFYFESSDGGSLQLKNAIRLRNQVDMVWRKVRR